MSNNVRIADISIGSFSLIENPHFEGTPTPGKFSIEMATATNKELNQVKLDFSFRFNQDEDEFIRNPYKLEAIVSFVFGVNSRYLVGNEIKPTHLKHLIELGLSTSRGILFTMIKSTKHSPLIISDIEPSSFVESATK